MHRVMMDVMEKSQINVGDEVRGRMSWEYDGQIPAVEFVAVLLAGCIV